MNVFTKQVVHVACGSIINEIIKFKIFQEFLYIKMNLILGLQELLILFHRKIN